MIRSLLSVSNLHFSLHVETRRILSQSDSKPVNIVPSIPPDLSAGLLSALQELFDSVPDAVFFIKDAAGG